MGMERRLHVSAISDKFMLIRLSVNRMKQQGLRRLLNAALYQLSVAGCGEEVAT
jgi:hypothetical protein